MKWKGTEETVCTEQLLEELKPLKRQCGDKGVEKLIKLFSKKQEENSIYIFLISSLFLHIIFAEYGHADGGLFHVCHLPPISQIVILQIVKISHYFIPS